MHSLSSFDNSALEQKHSGVIELELRDMSQLFNSMDPSPLENKDLNDDVEEFIVSWSEEYPARPGVNTADLSARMACRRSHRFGAK